MKTFPIMHGAALRAIPLDMIAPHERQAQKNHGQTLARLAQRGGLSPCEALAVIEDRPWGRDDLAEIALVQLIQGKHAERGRDREEAAP